jgi:hypothetical protein
MTTQSQSKICSALVSLLGLKSVKKAIYAV